MAKPVYTERIAQNFLFVNSIIVLVFERLPFFLCGRGPMTFWVSDVPREHRHIYNTGEGMRLLERRVRR